MCAARGKIVTTVAVLHAQSDFQRVDESRRIYARKIFGRDAVPSKNFS
jgi:hypothetical protein